MPGAQKFQTCKNVWRLAKILLGGVPIQVVKKSRTWGHPQPPEAKNSRPTKSAWTFLSAKRADFLKIQNWRKKNFAKFLSRISFYLQLMKYISSKTYPVQPQDPSEDFGAGWGCEPLAGEHPARGYIKFSHRGRVPPQNRGGLPAPRSPLGLIRGPGAPPFRPLAGPAIDDSADESDTPSRGI